MLRTFRYAAGPARTGSSCDFGRRMKRNVRPIKKSPTAIPARLLRSSGRRPSLSTRRRAMMVHTKFEDAMKMAAALG